MPTTLVNEIKQRLVDRIRHGEFGTGAKLPGERFLAQEYGVCRSTVVEALRLLAEDRLICKVAAKGNFVADHSLPLRIGLSSTLERIGGASEPTENNFLVGEIFRGIMAAAVEENVHFSFVCCPITDDPSELERQSNRFEEYDALLYISWELAALRRYFDGRKAQVIVGNDMLNAEDRRNCSRVGYNRKEAFALFFARKHFGRPLVLTFKEIANVQWFQMRVAEFRETAAECGVSLAEEDILEIASNEMAAVLPKCIGRDIFFNHTDLIPDFYRTAKKAGMQPGRDFRITILCSGMTLLNLEPPPDCLKIHFFEEGRQALHLAARLARERKVTPQHVLVPVTLENLR